MMGETKSRGSPNSLPTSPAGVRGSDHRLSVSERRREGISGVLLAAAFGHSLPVMIQPATGPGRSAYDPWRRGSVVQNHIEQRFMNPDAAVVFNKSELAKAIHKETNAGPGGANHFRKSFLGDLRNQ
jgi:hypothetical protein